MERAWIHVVFWSVNRSMRYLGTYHPRGFWGLLGVQEGGCSPEVPDPGCGGPGIGGCQAGCTQFPVGVAGARCQEQHLTHPKAVISHTQLLPASRIWNSQQGRARLNPRAGGSDTKPTPWEGKMIQVLSLQALGEHWESAVRSSVLGKAKEEFHRLLGWKKSPASAPPSPTPGGKAHP